MVGKALAVRRYGVSAGVRGKPRRLICNAETERLDRDGRGMMPIPPAIRAKGAGEIPEQP